MLEHYMSELVAYKNTGLTPEEIIDAKMFAGWIPVSEQLPEDDHSVLICSINGWQDVGWHEHGKWWKGCSHADIRNDIIAWMPLPEPYESKLGPEEHPALEVKTI